VQILGHVVGDLDVYLNLYFSVVEKFVISK